jgi:hypothetical protein
MDTTRISIADTTLFNTVAGLASIATPTVDTITFTLGL